MPARSASRDQLRRQRLERRERDLERRVAATEVAPQARELGDDLRGLLHRQREAVPAVAFARARARPAPPSRRSRSADAERCAGFGSKRMPAKRACRPANCGTASVQSERIARRYSSVIAPRRSKRTPSARNSASGVAAAEARDDPSARSSVERRERLRDQDRVVVRRTRTPVPRRRRVVSDATRVSATTESRKGVSAGVGPGCLRSAAPRCSPVHTESKPDASAARTARRWTSGSAQLPKLTPKRPKRTARDAGSRPDLGQAESRVCQSVAPSRAIRAANASDFAVVSAATARMVGSRRAPARPPSCS